MQRFRPKWSGYGCIYRVYSPSLGKSYIGSSTDTPNNRFKKHINNFLDWKKRGGTYCSSYEIMEQDDAQVELLEERKDWESKKEIRWAERKYIEENECVNIIKRPIITQAEKKNYQKNYKRPNIDTICDCGKIVKKRVLYEHIKSENHIKKMIELGLMKEEDVSVEIIQHINHKKEYMKTYGTTKITCECGLEIKRNSLSSHKKSKKHLKVVEKKKQRTATQSSNQKNKILF
jgi:hypothetical protein